MDSKGSVALRTKGTCKEIAQALGTSETAVKQWVTSKTSPTGRYRSRILATYGISTWDWDLPVGAEAPQVPLPSIPTGTLDPLERAQQQLRRLDDIRQAGVNSTATAMQLERVESKCLETLAKLRGDSITIDESKLAKTPAFKSLMLKILNALTPWPEAIKAVQKELSE